MEYQNGILNMYSSRQHVYMYKQKGEKQMAEYTTDNNWVQIAGTVDSDLTFSHEMYGEGFYNFFIAVPRLSDYIDRLPVTVSERLIGDIDLSLGTKVYIGGQLRSYNKLIDGANRLVLTIFVREITNNVEGIKNPNQIYLNGFVCKTPVYRITPFKREIADLLIAVNRSYNKSDYIPNIAWGRNARYCQNISVGDNIKIWGRIQSRQYQKKLPSGEIEERTAYEVSISKMEVVKADQNKEK